ncbi:MAG: hypothetical protein GY696_10850 [Gammaproteobacteria bacterium]|nr:hypothetical protein [Gammaproteobacteria bacterium]
MTNKNKAKPEAVADMAEADNIIGKGGFIYKSKTYTGSDKLETKASCGTSRPSSGACPCGPTIWARRKARS